MLLDHWIATLVAPLAFWILVNGLDDLVIDVAGLVASIRQRVSRDPRVRVPTEPELDAVPPRRMAVFVALWKEHRVIQKMIENNVTKLNYPCVEFFVGVYPNDAPTMAAVREVMKRFPNVHQSVCPHDGPTSKADCLNWIYQRMLQFEREHAIRFEMILTHDAEDLMDRDALRWINYYAQWYGMVQIPVLALPTPPREFAHGVYCDEFAEFQFKDMPARQLLGGFIPSNGVGTGFSRLALEKLARTYANRIFEPGCLTEDYENGFRIRKLGFAQKFIPIHRRRGRPIATREYFPRNYAAAVRQRSRWIMGITLQSWEFHSARETFRYLYWFWRDRKSLAGNLAAPLANAVFIYGAVTWAEAQIMHHAWGLAREMRLSAVACAAGLGLQALHTGIRIWCSGRIYGWRFAAGVPIRVLAGNWINSVATCRAVSTYAGAKLRKRPLRWSKTDHHYPGRGAPARQWKRIGEILFESGRITAGQLEEALATKPRNTRLGEHLVGLGCVSERDLYIALAEQNEMSLGISRNHPICAPVTRVLPAALSKRFRVLPFRIAAGELHLASPELPAIEMQREVRRFTSLELRFHLLMPSEFEDLAAEYLPERE